MDTGHKIIFRNNIIPWVCKTLILSTTDTKYKHYESSSIINTRHKILCIMNDSRYKIILHKQMNCRWYFSPRATPGTNAANINIIFQTYQKYSNNIKTFLENNIFNIKIWRHTFFLQTVPPNFGHCGWNSNFRMARWIYIYIYIVHETLP